MKIGTVVEWDSQTGGNSEFKTGRVVRVITSDDEMTPRQIAAEEFPGHNARFTGRRIKHGDPPAYLIEVLQGRNRKPHLYFPWNKYLKNEYLR